MFTKFATQKITDMVQEKKNQKLDFSVKSQKRCKECGELLKQNTVNKNPHADKCYVCFKISKGKKELTKRKFDLNGNVVREKTIDLLKIQKQNQRRNNWRGGRR